MHHCMRAMVSLCYAGRGVGQAIAEKYATEGFTLILTARSKDQLEEVRLAWCLFLPADRNAILRISVGIMQCMEHSATRMHCN